MNILDFSVILVAALFGIYGLGSAVECGLVLKMMGGDESSRKLFTPLWGVTNVSLVFGFTALAMLFNGGLTQLSHALTATLSVALISLLLRSCIVLAIFYIKHNDNLPPWLTWLLAITTFLIPLSFAASGVYLLTGQLFWHSLIGWLMTLSALTGLVSFGLLFVSRKQGTGRRNFGELVYAVWLLVLGCFLPLAVVHSSGALEPGPFVLIAGSAVVGLAFLVIRFTGWLRAPLWPIAGLILLATPLALAWANRPYLISGKLTLQAAYGAQAYGSAIVAGLIIMLPLICVGGYLFWKLYSKPNS